MLKVLQSGLTLVEDGVGRNGFVSSGVPRSGAFDPVALAQANYLVGNSLTSPGFEIHGGKFEFLVEKDTVVAVIGGHATILADGKVMYSQTAFRVPAYSFVSINPDVNHLGLTYVAVLGFSPSLELGSSSYDTFSKLGTSPVIVGDSFLLDSLEMSAGSFESRVILSSKESSTVYSIPVVQGVHFEKIANDTVFDTRVKTLARSGVRLELQSGSFKNLEAFKDLGSLPVFPGVVQVTPNGEIIILGPDSGVTGGYPILGYVPLNYIHLLSKLSTGEGLRLSMTHRDSVKKVDFHKLGAI